MHGQFEILVVRITIYNRSIQSRVCETIKYVNTTYIQQEVFFGRDITASQIASDAITFVYSEACFYKWPNPIPVTVPIRTKRVAAKPIATIIKYLPI